MAPEVQAKDASWLSLERVDRDPAKPRRVTGVVNLGGYRLQVVLDVGDRVPGLILYLDIPELLAFHEPSQRAVVAAMARLAEGEPVPLPLDLTDQIRDAQPPFPFRPIDADDRARLDAAAAEVDIHVQRVERTGSQPQVVHADLVVDGRPVSLSVELYSQPGAIPVMRRLAGAHFGEFTEAQLHAVERALRDEGTGPG
jgi:hypothetical protein